MSMYYSLSGSPPWSLSPGFSSLGLFDVAVPIHNSVLFLEDPRVLLCIPHIHATRSQALTSGQHLRPLCAVWNSSSLSALPPPKAPDGMALAHPSSCKSDSSLSLQIAFDGQVFLSLLLISLDVTPRLHLTCLMKAFGSSFLGFFICHQLVFLFSFFTVVPTPKSFSHCSEVDNYKMQFRLCESPA